MLPMNRRYHFALVLVALLLGPTITFANFIHVPTITATTRAGVQTSIPFTFESSVNAKLAITICEDSSEWLQVATTSTVDVTASVPRTVQVRILITAGCTFYRGFIPCIAN